MKLPAAIAVSTTFRCRELVRCTSRNSGEPLSISYESRMHSVSVANGGTRIAVLTDELAPQGLHSAFKLLPVLVDDVPFHDGSPLNIPVRVLVCVVMRRTLTPDASLCSFAPEVLS